MSVKPARKTSGIVTATEWNAMLDYVETFHIQPGAGLTMRNTSAGKQVALSGGVHHLWFCPEYAGAVLYDSSESNTGEMYGLLDSGHNSYAWETAEASAQEFSISLKFPVPYGFDGWTSCAFWAKCDSGGEVELNEVYDTNGDASLLAPVTVTATSWTEQDFSMPSGTYRPGQLARMMFRLEAPAGGQVLLGELRLGYRCNRA